MFDEQEFSEFDLILDQSLNKRQKEKLAESIKMIYTQRGETQSQKITTYPVACVDRERVYPLCVCNNME